MKKYTPLIAVSLALAALAPLQTKAANNTWIGASGGQWDLSTGGNWSPTSPWVNGDDAIFGAGGGSFVNLGSAVSAPSLTFSSPNYNIYSANTAFDLTLTGAVSITNNAADVKIQSSIRGTGGLKYYGTGDITLTGNTNVPSTDTINCNTYTGETFIYSGTLIGKAATNATGNTQNNLNNHGGQWAISAVGGVYPGAKLKIGNEYRGAQFNFLAPRGQIREGSHVIMAGGVFDGNGDDNLQSYPAIYGTGYVTNGSRVARSVLKMGVPDGVNQVVNCDYLISSPSDAPIVSPITNKFAGEIHFDLGGDGDLNGNLNPSTTRWIFSNTNKFYGTWRFSTYVRITKDGALGKVYKYLTPNTLRMGDGATLDLYGTTQETGGFVGGASSPGGVPKGRVCNNKPDSLAILTIGAANLGLNALAPSLETVTDYGTNILWTPGGGNVWAGGVVDNTGVGGKLGITKVGTNIAQFTGTWNISGPLVVSNGFLNLVPGAGAGATPVLNGPVYLYSNGNIPGTVTNSYLGLFTITQNAVIQVPALYIDGVPQTNGLYGAIGNTAGAREVSVISNGSTPGGDVLEVVNFQPPMTVTNNGTSLNISWPYATYKLQAQTNSTSVGITGTWSDYPGGGTSPVTVPIDQNNGTVFLKLSPKP